MKQQILNKVLDQNKNLIWKYTKSISIQKYFTKEEIEFLNNSFGNSLSEKFWCLLYGLKEAPKCPSCGNNLRFNSFKEGGYQKYCSNGCTVKGRNGLKYNTPKQDKTVQKNLNNLIDEGNKYRQYLSQRMKNGIAKEMLNKSIQNNGCHPWNSEKAIEKRYKKYVYKNEKFDSSWELAFWIYHKDHNIPIIHNHKKLFQYKNLENKIRWIIPDFIINNQIIEIKGDQFKNGSSWLKEWKNKEKVLLQNNVKILYKKDLDMYFDYIRSRYGKNYLLSFKTPFIKDYKRKVIKITKLNEIFELRNSNIKVQYECIKCHNNVITSVSNIIHHPDFLCKHCR